MESLTTTQKLVHLQGNFNSCYTSRTHQRCFFFISAVAATPLKTIASTFSNLKAAGKVSLIPFLTAGDPSLSTTAEALFVLDNSGADIIELGVPYFDPFADGLVIQAATKRALSKGYLDAVLGMLKEVLPRLKAPLVLFTYYDLILKTGIVNFLLAVKAVGVRGLLVPDLSLEDEDTLRTLSAHHGLELVLLTTPTTPKGRMIEICQASQGFIYLVSVTGVTGARSQVCSRVEWLLQDLKKVAEWGANGVIVGSAMVKVLGEAPSPQQGIAPLKSLTQDFQKALLPPQKAWKQNLLLQHQWIDSVEVLEKLR